MESFNLATGAIEKSAPTSRGLGLSRRVIANTKPLGTKKIKASKFIHRDGVQARCGGNPGIDVTITIPSAQTQNFKGYMLIQTGASNMNKGSTALVKGANFQTMAGGKCRISFKTTHDDFAKIQKAGGVAVLFAPANRLHRQPTC